MAIEIQFISDTLTRTSGSFLNPSQDFTVMIWFSPLTPLTSGQYRVGWQTEDNPFSVFFGIYQNDANQIEFDAANGVDPEQSIIGQVLTDNVWYHATLVYAHTTHTWSAYLNSVFVGSMTISVASGIFVEEDAGSDGGSSQPDDAVAYFRSWQAALSPTEIAKEMGSTTAVRQANLFTDTPLTQLGDLGDRSGNGHNWVAVGTPTTVPGILANLANGTVVFTGFGDATYMRFFSPAGVNLGQPLSQPIPGSGVDGIVVVDPTATGKVAIVGGNTPNFGTTGVGIFNADFTVFAQGVTGNGHPGFSIARDANAHFYGVRLTGGSNWTGGIAAYATSGAQVGSWQVFNGAGEPTGQAQGCAVSPDGQTAYVSLSVMSAAPVAVYKYNLGSSSFVGLFAAEAGYNIVSHNNLLCLPNGNVLIGWMKSGAPGFIREYAPDGSTVNTYVTPGLDPNPVNLTPSLTPSTSFWATAYDNSLSTHSGVRVMEIQIGTGTLLNNFTPDDGSFEFDSPACILSSGSTPPPPPAMVISATLDCTSKVLTINGLNFRAGATITILDSTGANVGFTLLSFSSTVIMVLLDYTSPGGYRITVTNPS